MTMTSSWGKGMWEYHRHRNKWSCGNPARMEYVHTGTPQNLAENKKSDARVSKFFFSNVLSDFMETTLANELCRKHGVSLWIQKSL